MKRWTSHEMLDLVLDEGTFTSWDQPIDLSGVEPSYRAVLEAAALKAGTDESVVTGRGEVRGRPVAVVVNEFGFLAGSIGRAAADRITAAVRRATAEGLPLLAGGKSMGGRMTSRAHAARPLHRVEGLVFFGFPLHPVGAQGTDRAEHLTLINQPMLFLQGTRDRLADPTLLASVLRGQQETRAAR